MAINLHGKHTVRNQLLKRELVPLYFKLLYKGISIRQFLGFALANVLGLTIVLSAVQFWQDVTPMLTSNDSFLRPGQFVVTKRVSEVKMLSQRKNTFTDSDVSQLRAQAFVADMAAFKPSRFSVYATIGNKSLGASFGTEMFFESIPDKYIDVVREDWSNYSNEECPIILPQNYLNLYNFGFATSRGLPSLTPSALAAIPIHLTLSGSRGTARCVGHVVGFSKQINTILVPEAWLDEQNVRLCGQAASHDDVSRLIIQVNDISDTRMVDYLQDHSLETEQGDDNAARTASFMRTVSIVVMCIGLVITILAFYVLILSIFILLQKHTEKIDNLLLMGYHPNKVALPFLLISHGMSLLSLVLAIPLVAYVRSMYYDRFGNLFDNMPNVPLSITILVGLILTFVIAIINHRTITAKVMEIWRLVMVKK